MTNECFAVDVFHIGPPKTATTWIYQCMREHPAFLTTKQDTVHYYDMFYAYGKDWYAKQFLDCQTGYKRGYMRVDATPSYIQSRRALERLVEENPEARIIIGLREPIERAFSHYWHLKKKGQISYQFEQLLENYTLFSLWLEPGFIARNLQFILKYIPRERIYTIHYEDLIKDSRQELQHVFKFCGVDETFQPSILDKRVNVAGPRQTLIQRTAYKAGRLVFGDRIDSPEQSTLLTWLSGKSEYQRGVAEKIFDRLKRICEPEIREIESALGVDLSRWRNIYQQEKKKK